jgi:hypothetical protein
MGGKVEREKGKSRSERRKEPKKEKTEQLRKNNAVKNCRKNPR